MSELSHKWAKVEIGDISDVIGGGTPKAKDLSNFEEAGQGIAWLTPADLSGFSDKKISHGKRDLSLQGLNSSSAKLMPEGSLLFSSRAPIGYVAIANNEISTNQGFKSFVFTEHVDSSYAYYYLRSIKNLAESLGTGTTFKELSGAAAKKLPFLLPPRNEQIRIANKLDSLLAKVDAAQARLDKIPTLLKRFRQSVLAAATSGELTREWRKENEVSKDSWAEKVFNELLTSVRSGSGDKPTDDPDGYAILRSSAVRDASIDFEDIRYLSPSSKINSANLLKIDDLIFTRLSGSSDYVGNCARVKSLPSVPIQYPDRLFCAQLTETTLAAFLEVYFCSPDFKRYILQNIKSSAGHQRITLEPIKNAKVVIPTSAEQTEIVRRVESLFTLADTVEKQYQEAKQRIDRLTQSILAKAFRGELVPQDPNDEPASELLKRIQAERAAQKPVKKTRKKKTKASEQTELPV